jgi:hypothetical protein
LRRVFFIEEREGEACVAYSYSPTEITARGKDQMRFELGDTLVEGGRETCALADEEYDGLLAGLKPGKRAWLSAKLSALEAIMFKLSYQPDTKIDVLQYGFGARAELWRKLYEQLRERIPVNTGVPTMAACAERKPPYFYGGMEENIRAETPPNFPFRHLTE